MANHDDRQLSSKAREPQQLTAEQIEKIRTRIDAGIYASEPVLLATARAILERGDPWPAVTVGRVAV